MTAKILIIIGTWLLTDAIFSLHAYWHKEGWLPQGFRWIRLGCAIIIIAIGMILRG